MFVFVTMIFLSSSSMTVFDPIASPGVLDWCPATHIIFGINQGGGKFDFFDNRVIVANIQKFGVECFIVIHSEYQSTFSGILAIHS
jgi:hypothetical protein